MKTIKNNYTNFILTLIAVVLMGILFKGSIITQAEAALTMGNYNFIEQIHENTRIIIVQELDTLINNAINSKCGN
jgi:hypothetical protein|tara:strand:- start:293 stop:517 length:225 start_codon:yes stop_codon:yes gene_type:complete